MLGWIGSVESWIGAVESWIGSVESWIGSAQRRIGAVREAFGSVQYYIGSVAVYFGSFRYFIYWTRKKGIFFCSIGMKSISFLNPLPLQLEQHKPIFGLNKRTATRSRKSFRGFPGSPLFIAMYLASISYAIPLIHSWILLQSHLLLSPLLPTRQSSSGCGMKAWLLQTFHPPFEVRM